MERDFARFPSLKFLIAEGAVRAAAVEGRRRIYTTELGHHGVDEFDCDARHIVACTANGTVVGACRIIGPEQRPLEIESDVDLVGLLGAISRPAQIGGLWIEPTYRSLREGQFLPLALMRCAFLVAEQLEISHLVMRTHIDAVKPLYLRAGFIEHPTFSYDHPLWGNVYVMSLDISELRTHGRASGDFIKRFIVTAQLANIHLKT